MQEAAVLVAELRDAKQSGLQELAKTIRAAVLKETSVSLHAVLFLRPRTIDKTTSGKLQRHKVRERFEAGSYGKALVKTCMLSRSEKKPPAGAVVASPRRLVSDRPAADGARASETSADMHMQQSLGVDLPLPLARAPVDGASRASASSPVQRARTAPLQRPASDDLLQILRTATVAPSLSMFRGTFRR